MRAGALLASDLAHSLTEPANLLFWQPAASGQQMLQQFLRMQAASQWLGSGNSAESSPTQVLSLGERVNIAGYTLTPALAQGLAAATLQPPADQPPGQLMWLEVSSQADPRLSAWAEKQAGRWQTAGWRVRAHAVSAPPFWQTVGTENAPALINATLTALTLGTAPLAAQVVATENKAL
jgi:exosortase A-associated hydrolase 2